MMFLFAVVKVPLPVGAWCGQVWTLSSVFWLILLTYSWMNSQCCNSFHVTWNDAANVVCELAVSVSLIVIVIFVCCHSTTVTVMHCYHSWLVGCRNDLRSACVCWNLLSHWYLLPFLTPEILSVSHLTYVWSRVHKTTLGPLHCA